VFKVGLKCKKQHVTVLPRAPPLRQSSRQAGAGGGLAAPALVVSLEAQEEVASCADSPLQPTANPRHPVGLGSLLEAACI
jgi:hypothetical protein